MYKFKETTPNWMYHKANLDFTALPAIQKELGIVTGTLNEVLSPWHIIEDEAVIRGVTGAGVTITVVVPWVLHVAKLPVVLSTASKV